MCTSNRLDAGIRVSLKNLSSPQQVNAAFAVTGPTLHDQLVQLLHACHADVHAWFISKKQYLSYPKPVQDVHCRKTYQHSVLVALIITDETKKAGKSQAQHIHTPQLVYSAVQLPSLCYLLSCRPLNGTIIKPLGAAHDADKPFQPLQKLRTEAAPCSCCPLLETPDCCQCCWGTFLIASCSQLLPRKAALLVTLLISCRRPCCCCCSCSLCCPAGSELLSTQAPTTRTLCCPQDPESCGQQRCRRLLHLVGQPVHYSSCSIRSRVARQPSQLLLSVLVGHPGLCSLQPGWLCCSRLLRAPTQPGAVGHAAGVLHACADPTTGAAGAGRLGVLGLGAFQGPAGSVAGLVGAEPTPGASRPAGLLPLAERVKSSLFTGADCRSLLACCCKCRTLELCCCLGLLECLLSGCDPTPSLRARAVASGCCLVWGH
jgi:hypothetical protein